MRQLNTAKSTKVKQEYELKTMELKEQLEAIEEAAKEMRSTLERG
ncbi:hypothetical protein [Streptomyces sp. H39-C1]|nr:hypothetical protein [Streptomyces sp. H39-C1]MCZ4096088.1 hypothetical protein [Streptomyces sp. H39-C1]